MATFVSVDDFRTVARRRLPRAIFDFMDGGAYSEATLRANRAAFERVTFRPRVMVDVAGRDLSTTVLGQTLAMPLVLAPVGLAGLFARSGEALALRAAERAGIVGCLSTTSVVSVEQARAATERPFWFQLYLMKDRGFTRALLERAQAQGCTTLIFTVDLPIQGQRDRDVRNGFTVPPRVTLTNALDVLRRVGWMRDVLAGPTLTFGNLAGLAPGKSDLTTLAAHIARTFEDAVSWRDLEWARGIWRGPIAIKGILTPEDARLAAEHGAEAIVVSNHGGRQLDGAPATLDVLPEIAAAVGDRIQILFDGGIRRGADVLKAIALGARACLIGRAWAYALGAGGEAGVTRALEILRKEMDVALGLLGRSSIGAIDRSAVRVARE
jgi:L-lactate dehydrogenase (cytochrome)